MLRRRQAQPSKLHMASCTVTAASVKVRPWKMHQKPAKAAQGQQHCMRSKQIHMESLCSLVRRGVGVTWRVGLLGFSSAARYI